MEVVDETNEVSSKHCFEVKVSSKHRFEVEVAQNTVLRL
ncbi:chlorohydrolase [Streptococcus pneumoniae]|nr:chlorohydrolase [Streptococcus pneumoniae]